VIMASRPGAELHDHGEMGAYARAMS
jgi:hypothetical protein